MFKTGDKVRCVDPGSNASLKKGEIYEVTADQLNHWLGVRRPDGKCDYYLARRFELVTFKKGDFIVWEGQSNDCLTHGKTYEIFNVERKVLWIVNDQGKSGAIQNTNLCRITDTMNTTTVTFSGELTAGKPDGDFSMKFPDGSRVEVKRTPGIPKVGGIVEPSGYKTRYKVIFADERSIIVENTGTGSRSHLDRGTDGSYRNASFGTVVFNHVD
jgi:hypothetical protein